MLYDVEDRKTEKGHTREGQLLDPAARTIFVVHNISASTSTSNLLLKHGMPRGSLGGALVTHSYEQS